MKRTIKRLHQRCKLIINELSTLNRLKRDVFDEISQPKTTNKHSNFSFNPFKALYKQLINRSPTIKSIAIDDTDSESEQRIVKPS